MAKTTNSTNKILKNISLSVATDNSSMLGENLVLLVESEPDRWLSLLYLNNVLPEPDNNKFKETILSLINGFAKALKKDNISLSSVDSFGKTLHALLSLHICFSSITQKLDKLDVWEKPGTRVLFRVSAFLEEQTYLLIDRIDKEVEKKGYYDIFGVYSDNIPTLVGGPDTNSVASYEGLSEDLQLILAYSQFKYRGDFFGKIGICKSPYDDVDFAKLIALARVWRIYKYLWDNVKLLGWVPFNSKDLEDVTIYHPQNVEEFIRFEVGKIRLGQIKSEFFGQVLSIVEPEFFEEATKLRTKIADSIHVPILGEIWDGQVDIEGLKTALNYRIKAIYEEAVIDFFHYEQLLPSITFDSSEEGLNWFVYKNTINTLQVLAEIIQVAIRKKTPNYDHIAVLRRVLIVRKSDLVNIILKITDYELKVVQKILNLLIFNPKLTYLEIWDTPLIEIASDLILFVPSLIINGSPVRAVENFITQWNENLFSKRGKLLEIEIQDFLLGNRIPVQGNITFKTNSREDVECDLVVWWDGYLILMEAKCTKSVFSPSDFLRARNHIDYSINQLNRRRDAIIEYWPEFRSAATKLELPIKSPPLKNIKLVAVTNVLHFTSWVNRNVIVTDEFCIRRFFGSAEIEAIYGGEIVKVVGNIRKPGIPTAEEFISYLIEPPQVSFIKKYLTLEPQPMPLVKDTDPKIAITQTSYSAPDYFQDFDFNQKVEIKEKTPRNSPCPCGSSLKYKKCCGRINRH